MSKKKTPIEKPAEHVPMVPARRMMELVLDFKTSSNLAHKIEVAALNPCDRSSAGASAVVWDRAANLILHAITKV
jgi:hypothetical protein